MNYLVNDWLTVVAGKFLSPIGQYQQALHAPWINKLPTAPAGFTEEEGASPMADTGVMIRGGFKVGPGMISYAAFVGNGPRLGEHGPMFDGFGGDDNRDKAIGGRVSYLPTPDWELGLSAMRARIRGMDALGGEVSQATSHCVAFEGPIATSGLSDEQGPRRQKADPSNSRCSLGERVVDSDYWWAKVGQAGRFSRQCFVTVPPAMYWGVSRSTTTGAKLKVTPVDWHICMLGKW